MPAVTPLTINDGQATPVAHTFGVGPLIGTKAQYYDRSGGVSIGYPNIMIDAAQPTGRSNLFKTRVKIVVPVLEVVNASTYNGITPAPTKAYDLTFDGVFIIPARAALAQRKDLLAYVKNTLANAVITAVVETQETIY